MPLSSVLLLLAVPSAVCWVALRLRCLSGFQCDWTHLVYFGKVFTWKTFTWKHLHEKLNPDMKRRKSKWIFCRLLKRSSVLSHPFAIPRVVTQLWGKEWTLIPLSSAWSQRKHFSTFFVLKDVSSCSLFFFSSPAPFIERAKSVFPFQSLFSCTFCLAPTQICTVTPKHSLCPEHSQKLLLAAPWGCSQQKTILFSRNGSQTPNRQECVTLVALKSSYLPYPPCWVCGATRWHSVTIIF